MPNKLKKSIMFLGFLLICIFSISLTNNEVHANSTSLDSASEIDINGNYYERIVSEEEVIRHYMEGKDIDLETAKKDLGISDQIAMAASCSSSWREYSSGKKLVDSGTKTYLTVYPYVQIKVCSGSRSIVSVSPKVRTVKSGLMSGYVKITDSFAVKESSSIVKTRAYGPVKNFLGITLRHWSYDGGVNSWGRPTDF